MHASQILSSALLASLALAETQTVWVSNKDGDLTFKPSTISAAVGDVVKFKFYPENHSVVQSSFDSPCTPLDGGIWSDFHAVNDTAGDATNTFDVTINSTDSIWLYCSQGTHCQGGMVAVINQAATGGNTLAKYKAAAAEAADNLSPTGEATGGVWSASSASSSGSASGSASSSATGSATSSSSTTDAGVSLDPNMGLTAVMGVFGVLAYLF